MAFKFNPFTGKFDYYEPLPIASGSTLGGIKVGSRLSIDGAGILSADVQTQDLSGYALLVGRAGGQTLKGGTAASETLTLQSTNHATKGKILFGTSAYDEVNNWLGIGTASPALPFEVYAQNGGAAARFVSDNAGRGFVVHALTNIATNAGYSVRIDIKEGANAINTIASFSVNNLATLADLLLNASNIGIGQTTFGTSAAKVLAFSTGTAPSSAPADAFQMYSADQAAGNACPTFRTENGRIVKLYTVVDARIDDTINSGDATTDGVIEAIRTALQAHGLMAAA